VPVDGEVYQGSATVTIEHLTGETKPLERTVGDAIPGGARNLEGMMIVKVCFAPFNEEDVSTFFDEEMENGNLVNLVGLDRCLVLISICY